MTQPIPPDSTLRRNLRIALPVLVLALAAGVAYLGYRLRPIAETAPEVITAPLVEVQTLTASSPRVTVTAQGTVRPHTSTLLVAEVAGRVVEVAAQLDVGSFFDAGALLVKIDPRDYELGVVRARAAIAEARYSLELERAEAASAVEDWQRLEPDRPAPELVRRTPQLAAQEARLAAAEADLAAAELALERTEVRAPYAGRVRSKHVEFGQFVARGTALAQVYSVDFAEVRLPLHDRDLAFLELPLGAAELAPGHDEARRDGPPVTIRADFAGRVRAWHGTIVRSEGELDPTSRMLHVIARIDDPYAIGGAANGDAANGDAHADEASPLLVGMFVDAEIAGRRLEGVFDIPRSALGSDERVLLVESLAEGETVLREAAVEVVRTTADRALVRGDLADGALLCLTRLEVWTDGMRVRVRDDAVTPEPTTEESR